MDKKEKEKQDKAIRVVLEDYNPRTGRHDESLIYRNKIEPKKKKVARTKKSSSWADMAVSSNGRVGYLSDDIICFFLKVLPMR